MSGILLACIASTGAAGGGGGGGAGIVNLSTTEVIGIEVSPGTASAEYQLNVDGTAYGIVSLGGTYAIEAWCNPAIYYANYEVLATLLSGTLDSGTTGSWQALTASRSWANSTTAAAVNTSLSLAIRAVSNPGVVLASANVNLSSEIVTA